MLQKQMIEPRLLVTVGAWSEKSSTDRYVDDHNFYRNLWKDECLRLAGEKYNGVLDFYQIHTYQWNGNYNEYAPLSDNLNSVSFYHLDRPVIIGEFGIKHGGTDKEKKYWKTFAGKRYKGIYRKGLMVH